MVLFVANEVPTFTFYEKKIKIIKNYLKTEK
jgi:hypothetical protein